jgi:hypothetical protein
MIDVKSTFKADALLERDGQPDVPGTPGAHPPW